MSFSVVQAQSRIVNATGEYIFFADLNENFAEEKAHFDAKRNAVEQTALYLQSHSKLKNYKVSQDSIRVFAVQILQVIKEETFVEIMDEKTKKFVVKIEAVFDDSRLDEKFFKRKIELTDLYKELNTKYEEQKKFNEDLKRRYSEGVTSSEIALLKSQVSTYDKNFQIISLMSQAIEFSKKENYSKALEISEEVLKYDLNNSPLSVDNIYLFAGGCYVKMENYGKAIEYIKKAYAINPRNESARKAQALEYYFSMKRHADRKEYDKVIEDAQICIVINPDDPNARQLLTNAYLLSGNQYMEKGDLNKAVTRLEDALSVAPQSMGQKFFSACYFKLAELHGELKNYSKALEYYTKLSELNPHDEELKKFVEEFKNLLSQDGGN